MSNDSNTLRRPLPGDVWKHHNGGLYEVRGITNEHSENKRYQPQVVYQGENGRLWSRPLSNWHRSMSIHRRGEKSMSIEKELVVYYSGKDKAALEAGMPVIVRGEPKGEYTLPACGRPLAGIPDELKGAISRVLQTACVLGRDADTAAVFAWLQWVPTWGGSSALPAGWQVRPSPLGTGAIQVSSPEDRHCLLERLQGAPEHHPKNMAYNLAAAIMGQEEGSK